MRLNKEKNEGRVLQITCLLRLPDRIMLPSQCITGHWPWATGSLGRGSGGVLLSANMQLAYFTVSTDRVTLGQIAILAVTFLLSQRCILARRGVYWIQKSYTSNIDFDTNDVESEKQSTLVSSLYLPPSRLILRCKKKRIKLFTGPVD